LTPLKLYLLAYNVANLAAWGYILTLMVQFLFVAEHPTITVEAPASALSILSKILPSSVLPAASGSVAASSLPAPLAAAVNHLKGSYNYKNIGVITTIVQSVAVLEIVHAALGWVRSDVVTVAMQVSSRLWSVWGIVEAFPHIAQNHPLYTTMVTAWAVAEVIRYSFYALALVGIQPAALNWLR
jgi:very-long-chain (3R)-3-hydroxyacyl-CoA dehydratase